jgi:predicted nucleic acid-binding protein
MVDADWEITHQAALFKAQGGLSFADCCAAARGKLRAAEIVTGDPEFEWLAGVITITWGEG